MKVLDISTDQLFDDAAKRRLNPEKPKRRKFKVVTKKQHEHMNAINILYPKMRVNYQSSYDIFRKLRKLAAVNKPESIVHHLRNYQFNNNFNVLIVSDEVIRCIENHHHEAINVYSREQLIEVAKLIDL